MGVQVGPQTLSGGKTLICNCCGSTVCWNISQQEYLEAKAFWDNWVCEDCNGGVPLSLKRWKAAHGAALRNSSSVNLNRSA